MGRAMTLSETDNLPLTGAASQNQVTTRTPKPSLDHFSLGTHFTLALGFGSLLAIMALAGFDGMRTLGQISRTSNRIREQFLATNHILNHIQSQLYISATYVRDYLLDPDPAGAEARRADLEHVRREMDSAVESYGRQPEAIQAQHYAELTVAVSQYWAVLDPILKWDAARRRAQGYGFLRDQVFPRRSAMLELADRIQAINEQQLDAGNQRLDRLLGNVQDRLLATLVAALLLGAGMAAFSTTKILRLEARAAAQYQEVTTARGQLKELSDRLVQIQESERRTLSRELHDEVGQSLATVLVELRNLSSELGTRLSDRASSHLAAMKSLLENSVRVVRNMALLLRPSMLDDLGLVPALRWQAREMSKRTPMDVGVSAELGPDELPDAYRTCVYRVVQEALSNCARHAQAKVVRIRVQQEPSRLLLSIQDDGQGFDVTQTKGLGLLGIQERVVSLGGEYRISSEPGNGTIISIKLPYDSSIRG
jgi:signal transduction histidine kinase